MPKINLEDVVDMKVIEEDNAICMRNFKKIIQNLADDKNPNSDLEEYPVR